HVFLRSAPPNQRAPASPPRLRCLYVCFRASSRLHQNPIRGVLQGIDNRIRLARPVFAVPGFFAQAVPGPHKDRFAARAKSQLHVAVTISHYIRARQIKIVFAHRTLNHSRIRLAAIAGGSRTMRAIVNTIQTGDRNAQFALHALIHLLYERLGEIAASYPGLVGYYNHSQTRVIQATYGCPCKRKHTKSIDVIQVTNFFGNGAVAVQEDRGLRSSWVRQKTPPKVARAWRLLPFPA